MEQREKMGPVELVNWWTSFRKNTREMEKFDELDGDVRAQILKWESNPYKDIGA